MKNYFNKGFTLVEILVVMSIISLLSSVVLNSLNSARNKGVEGSARQFDANIYHSFGADPIAIWNFDDSANLGNDSSGNGKHAGIISPAFYTSSGLARGAMDLTLGGYLTTTGGTPINALSNFTDVTKGSVSMWAKLNSVPSVFTYFWIIGPSTRLYYDPGAGNLSVIVAGTSVALSIVKPFQPNTNWTHYFVSWDKATQNLSLYVNGKLLGTATGDPNPIMFTTGNLRLGAASVSQIFNGQIDEVRIYSQGLQTAEIEKIYAEGLATHGFAVK